MNTSIPAEIFSSHPEIGAVLVIVIGLVLARVFAGAAARFAGWLDQRISRYSTTDAYVISPARMVLLRGGVFWLTLGIAVVIALRLLGVGGFALALDHVLAFVPRLLIGLVIIGVGHLLGVIVRGLISRISDGSESSLAPRISYASVLTVAVVMSLQQMGIDTTFLTQLLLVVLIVSLGGLTLAFALGSREYVANLIARAELERYAVGELLKVGEHEGTVVEVRSTGIDLATDIGIVSIPASRFARVAVVRLADSADE